MKFTLPRKTTMLQGRKTSFALSVFNLMNAIMGSGMLALPYILARSGVAVFVVLMILMALVVDYSLHLLISAAKTSGMRSYEDLCEHALGSWGRVVVCVAIVVQNTGSMTTYLKVVGDTMPSAIRKFGAGEVDRALLMAVVTVAIILPLSVPRSISGLGSISGISIMIMFGFTLTVIARSGDTCDGGVSCGDGEIRAVHLTMDTFLALPTMCFSYVCHTCLLPVFSELYEADTQGRRFRRDTRMMNVAHMAIGFCTLMYLATALWGYITFKDNTDKDLLDNYTDHMDNGFTAGLSTALCVSFVFTVPLIHFPHRRSLEPVSYTHLTLPTKRIV
eukprot:TRINITY_DN2789_c0_g1_i3.p1 TRINITY_DN2789_c0_g1~~TRINITY_DN2789_c0_g1_i3.p1  ORF type:complete len:333 (-),score=70.14 TRINITY_DN2789_c0_g1_i3:134-1132(-)